VFHIVCHNISVFHGEGNFIEHSIRFIREYLAGRSSSGIQTVLGELFQDIGPYTITQWTGHSFLAAMKPYMAIADKEKKNAMKKFDEV